MSVITPLNIELQLKPIVSDSDKQLVSAKIIEREDRDNGEFVFKGLAVEKNGTELRYSVCAGGRMSPTRTDQEIILIATSRLTDYFNLVQDSITNNKLRKQLFPGEAA